MQTPLKYIFSESLIIVAYGSILIKTKKCHGSSNIAPCFQKCRGSLVKFVSSQI